MQIKTLTVGEFRSLLEPHSLHTALVFTGAEQPFWSFYRVKSRDGDQLAQIELSEPEDSRSDIRGATVGELLDRLREYPDDCELVFNDGVALCGAEPALILDLRSTRSD